MPDAVPQPGVSSLVIPHRLERSLLGTRGFCLIARVGIRAGGTYDVNSKDY